MKIAYLIFEDVRKHSGLKQKIGDQIALWESAGHEVHKVYGRLGIVDPPINEVSINTSVPKSKLGKLLQKADEYAFVKNVLLRINPDIIYARYLFPAWGVQHLKPNATKLILEVNSDDKYEYLGKNIFTGLLNAAFRRIVLKMADGLVFVTNELAGVDSFKALTDVQTVIANGIDCQKVSLATLPNNKKPQLAFIGSPHQNWHGVDKLIHLAELLPASQLHIIGPDEKECLKYWGSMPSNVTIHGYLNAAQSTKILSTIDVAISTLALYRKSMHEACPLKVRQYLAHGIPIIGASDDTDIVDDMDFYFKLPNCEDNILPYATGIKQFVDDAFNNNDLRLKARSFAETQLDVRGKEKKRLNFFKEVLNG